MNSWQLLKTNHFILKAVYLKTTQHLIFKRILCKLWFNGKKRRMCWLKCTAVHSILQVQMCLSTWIVQLYF